MLTIPKTGSLHVAEVLFLGSPGSGATSFVNRYVDGVFDPFQGTTPFSGSKIGYFMAYDGDVRIIFGEPSASAKCCPLAIAQRVYNYGFIVMYDVTKRSSVDAIRQRYLRDWNDAPFAVVRVIGTKIDLEDKREVSVKEGEALARDLHASLFFEGKLKSVHCL